MTIESSSVASTLTFGCNHDGTPYPIGDVGGQYVYIYGVTGNDSRIYGIKIGEMLYGSTSGSLQAVGQLPPDGTFTLYELESSHNWFIYYMNIVMSGTSMIAGYKRLGNPMLAVPNGLRVKFSTIRARPDGIIQLTFSVLS